MAERTKKYWQKYRIWAIAIGLILANVFIVWPYFSPSKAVTTNLYALNCSGDWFGVDRVVGPPEISEGGSFEDFNTENSAFYQSGFQSIICNLFEIFEEEKENKKIISARLGLSLAINEIYNNSQEEPSSSTTSNEESPTEEQALEEKQQLDNNQNKEETNQNYQEKIIEEEPVEEQILNFLFNQWFVRLGWLNILPVLAQETESKDNPVEEIKEVVELGKKEDFIEEQTVLEKESLIKKEEGEEIIIEEEKNEPENIIFLDDLLNNIENDLTPVFLPPELSIQKDNLSQSELLINEQIDAILNLRYYLDDNDYQLAIFKNYPISPVINNGYFYFDLPEITSFEDLEKFSVSLEGLLAGDPHLIAWLDSVWLEVTYQEEIIKSEFVSLASFDGNDWEVFAEKDGKTYQITDNDFDDRFPVDDGNNIVWQSQINGRWQVFWLNFESFLAGQHEPRQLTSDKNNNIELQIKKGMIIWRAWLDNNWEIMFFNTNNLDQKIERITNNQEHDLNHSFSNNEIIWETIVDQEKNSFRAKKEGENWVIEKNFNQIEE